MFGSPVKAALLAAFVVAACAQTAADLAEAGGRLSASQARKVAAQVDANPENLDARVKLASYYWRKGLGKPWQQQVLWMIEHHPESALLDARTLWMQPPGADATAFREAWLGQVTRKPVDPVLNNAFRALASGSLWSATDLLREALVRSGVDEPPR